MANVQLSTLGNVIKTAYESQENTNVFTDLEKQRITNLVEPILSEGNIIIGAESGAVQQPFKPIGAWQVVTVSMVSEAGGFSQTVNHNYGYKPLIKVLDGDLKELDPLIVHIDDNSFAVKANFSFSGSILMS